MDLHFRWSFGFAEGGNLEGRQGGVERVSQPGHQTNLGGLLPVERLAFHRLGLDHLTLHQDGGLKVAVNTVDGSDMRRRNSP